mgnify:CR=1 FL=1
MKGFMFRKVTSLILVLLMIASTMVVVPFGVAAVEADLTIATPAELVAFKQAIADGNDYAGKTIKLTADIDMSGVENWPITNNTFNGIFDGDGYSIYRHASDCTSMDCPVCDAVCISPCFV